MHDRISSIVHKARWLNTSRLDWIVNCLECQWRRVDTIDCCASMIRSNLDRRDQWEFVAKKKSRSRRKELISNKPSRMYLIFISMILSTLRRGSHPCPMMPYIVALSFSYPSVSSFLPWLDAGRKSMCEDDCVRNWSHLLCERMKKGQKHKNPSVVCSIKCKFPLLVTWISTLMNARRFMLDDYHLSSPVDDLCFFFLLISDWPSKETSLPRDSDCFPPFRHRDRHGYTCDSRLLLCVVSNQLLSTIESDIQHGEDMLIC